MPPGLINHVFCLFVQSVRNFCKTVCQLTVNFQKPWTKLFRTWVKSCLHRILRNEFLAWWTQVSGNSRHFGKGSANEGSNMFQIWKQSQPRKFNFWFTENKLVKYVSFGNHTAWWKFNFPQTLTCRIAHGGDRGDVVKPLDTSVASSVASSMEAPTCGDEPTLRETTINTGRGINKKNNCQTHASSDSHEKDRHCSTKLDSWNTCSIFLTIQRKIWKLFE